MSKRLLVAALVTGLAWSQAQSVGVAKDTDSGFAGIEFYGSSQIGRTELEKELGLHQGAGYESTWKAAQRLKERLERKHIHANVDVASEGEKCYVTVDVMESGATGIPVRKLHNPHKVYLSSDAPLQTLSEMFARIQSLAQQGRPVTETYENGTGIKYFSDEPCNQWARKLVRQVPAMRSEFVEMINSDPDAARRSAAIELLSWDDQPWKDCVLVTGAVDDGAEQVRASAARFLFPRIKFLPDNFPMADTIDAFSHQLSRPSHLDRMLALRCLAEIQRTHPFTAAAIREADEQKLQELESNSLLSAIKQPAQRLLSTGSRP